MVKGIARTAFVTGASSGIGRALAKELAGRGAKTAVLARRKEELDSLVREIEAAGGSAIAYELDVRKTDDVKESLARADKDLGALDLVIANAGVGTPAHATRLTWDQVAPLIDVNVTGALATLVHAIPILLLHQRGHLVATTSLAGLRGLPTSAAYSASKAAVSTFLQSIRIDLAGTGISVTDIQPGFVDTPIKKGTKMKRPFEWPADKAARVIVDRLARKPAVISFPFPVDTFMGVMRFLPTWLYEAIARRSTPEH